MGLLCKALCGCQGCQQAHGQQGRGRLERHVGLHSQPPAPPGTTATDERLEATTAWDIIVCNADQVCVLVGCQVQPLLRIVLREGLQVTQGGGTSDAHSTAQDMGCTCSGTRRQQSAQSTAHLRLGRVERPALLSSVGRQLVQGSKCQLFANLVAVGCSFGVGPLMHPCFAPKNGTQGTLWRPARTLSDLHRPVSPPVSNVGACVLRSWSEMGFGERFKMD